MKLKSNTHSAEPPVKRRSYLFTVILTVVYLGGEPIFSEAPRPNILFVFTDDHAAHAISAYGSKVNKTPNMDRLANEGMLFRNCYVTNSICGPSRAVILTGKHSHLNGFIHNGNTFNGEQQTFPKLLRNAGYQTAIVGKWHLGSTPTGFDYFDVLIGQGPYYNPPMKTIVDGKVVVQKNTGYTTDVITDKTLAWLKDQRDPNKPFMLMYQHKAPHRNWQPGPQYLTLFDDVTIPEPATLWDDYKGRTSSASEQAMTIRNHLSPNDLKLNAGPGNLTPEQKKLWDAAYGPKNKAFQEAKLEGDDLVRWKYQRYAKDYLRCIQSVDDNLGRVLDYLDETGLSKNTVVIYSSDQGWYLGDHGWYDKRWMYQESLIMPLIIRWPQAVKPGSVNESIVSNLDFAETFLDLAGVEIPSDMQGRSIVPLMKGQKPADWRESFYYHYYEFPGAHNVNRHYGVTNGKHKLINFYHKKEWELFDLSKDPNELMSVYANPEYAEVKKSLETELARLRKQFQLPEDEPAPRKPPPAKQEKKKPEA
ncbi:MAG: sulfatase [Planctomycetota bacterium]|nr:sulfatase [Planctomycetota bacterium]MDA1136978.1 sulfatase [Planctomycetota bacterium]